MFLLLPVLAILLIIGIPIGLSYLIYRFIKKRNYDKRLRLIALTPILIMTYLIYTAVYPSEDFYREDFVEVTGTELPEQVEFKYKSATYPDQFGDYTSISIINVGKDFYIKLPNTLTQKGLKESGQKIYTTEFDKALEHIGNLEIEKGFSMEEGGGVYYYVGFLTDNETIIAERLSW